MHAPPAHVELRSRRSFPAASPNHIAKTIGVAEGMRRAAQRGERPKDPVRVRSYAVSAGRSIAGPYSFRSNGATFRIPPSSQIA